ncbi:MAG: hypothetical protein JNL90_09510 [Planctomycetes bacterium]|nr:hypothetical protein [Planctomycetota bacterium]
MRNRQSSVSNSRALWSLALLAGAACSGGGGGSSAGSKAAGFRLTDVKYGRVIDEGNGPRLVSPLTTVDVDPVTGRVLPGSLQPLASGVDVDALQSLGLGTSYLPRVVPRNGVLKLEFTAPIDPASVSADQLDANGALVTAGSVQVRLQDGTPVAVEVTLVNPTTIWIDPVAASGIGFPPSPVNFGPTGAPRADATGYLKLRLPRTGSAVLRSTNGTFLAKRDDGLGEVATPIGINPGNRVLDFIAQNQLIPTNETYNGFLPDESVPRIVRTHSDTRVVDVGGGDVVGADTVQFSGATFSTLAKSGSGEWAGANFVVRPGAPDEETIVVVGNTADTLTLEAPFVVAPIDGDTCRLERTEYYEPELTDPIDPALFDPDNPENATNASLANFVEAWEIDSAGNVVAGPISLRDALPTYCELRVRFTEPMAEDSFLPWETFRVSPNPDAGELQELLTDVSLDVTQKTAIIRPIRLDQASGTFQLVGWGKSSKNLQLNITTVPRASYLQQKLGSSAYTTFLDDGVLGVVDLGGQPLGFPDSRFDPANPAIRYSTTFTATEAAITQPFPPLVESWGVIVHRMRGRPVTGIDPATGLPGVGYRDQPNYYRPIPDVNLQSNGILAGSPVVYVTKIHDEFFPPEGQFSKLFTGLPEPLTSNVTAQNQPHDGARFQTVWRDFDCSPNSAALAGTLLDLYQVSWAPIGGNVSTDVYDNISIHCAHAPIRPISQNNTGGASYPSSGMSIPFDYATFIDLIDGGTNPCPGAGCGSDHAPNHWDTLVTVVQPGTQYRVTQPNVFTPPGDGNAWHPWPVFSVPFQYNNGDLPQAEIDLRKSVNSSYNTCGEEWGDYRTSNNGNLGGDSLLFEVRVRPQTTTVTGQNGFSFVIGCLIDFNGSPRWRVGSQGSPTTRLNPDNLNQPAARCAKGNTTSTAPVPGDNSRYLAVFDYVKTTSRITSPYVRVYPSNTALPDYFPAIVYPPLSSQPVGTSVVLEFEGAVNTKGATGTGFSTSVDVADTKGNIAFRATLTGSKTSLLLPNLDTIAIPFRRPTGS